MPHPLRLLSTANRTDENVHVKHVQYVPSRADKDVGESPCTAECWLRGSEFELACLLEAGEGGGALERLAQRVDALGSVLAGATLADAADGVVAKAAKKCRQRACYWAVKGFE